MIPRKQEKMNLQPASTFGRSFRLTGSHGSRIRWQAHIHPSIVPGGEIITGTSELIWDTSPCERSYFFTQIPDIYHEIPAVLWQ